MSTPVPLFPPTTGPLATRKQVPGSFELWFDGTHYHADSLTGGLDYVSATLPGPIEDFTSLYNNALNAISSGTLFFKGGTTYNANRTVQLKTGIYLVSEGPGSAVLNGLTGIGKLIQTNVASPSGPNLDMKVAGFDLEMPSTEQNHVWAIGAQRFRMQDCILGGGNPAFDAILIQDTATVGSFFNVFDNVQARASLATRSGYSFQGFNPGPNWIYGGTTNFNTLGLDVQASQQYVYGMEVEQGPGVVAGSIPIKLAKGPNANFNPKLVYIGDFEPSGTPTTAISIDANSLGVFTGNFSITASQIAVATGGVIIWNNLATTNTQSLQGFAMSTPTVGASGADVQNANPFPVRVYITGVGSGITAYGITDLVGTLTSFTTTVNVGNFFEIDPFGKIRLTYTGSPTWKWYGK